MLSNKYRHIIAQLLTIIMVSYVACVVVFKHVHIVDSHLITHSHPYSSTSHTHSAQELDFLSVLSTINYVDAHADFIVEPQYHLLYKVELINNSLSLSNVSYLISLRGPPSNIV